MTNAEKLEQFRRDIKSVNFWSASIREINEELQSVKVQRNSLQPNKGTKNPLDENQAYTSQLDLLEKQLLKVREKFIERILDIETIFLLFDHEVEQDMMVDLYLLNQKYAQVAIKYSYAESTMFDRISKIILRVL